MLSDRRNLNEMAHIGEELISRSSLTNLDRKCLIIMQTVHDQDFTLEEALKIYEVSKADYESFMAKNFVSEMENSVGFSASSKLKSEVALQVITEMYRIYFGAFDKHYTDVIVHLEKLSKDIEEGKVPA